MFDNTSDQMNNWRWENPSIFREQANWSNWQTTSFGMVQQTGDHFSSYGSNNFRAKIEPPHCQHSMSGNFRAITPLNWDEITDEEDGDDNGADPRAPRCGWSRPSDGNDNDNCEGEEDTKSGEKGTRKGNGTKDGKGKGKGKATKEEKGKGKVNGKGKGIVTQTSGGDDISRAIVVQLHKEMYEADSDTEG
jgi:hypothetical protein